MAKRFAVMEFTSRSRRRWRRGMKRLLGHAPVELPTAAALFAKRTHASCDASPIAQPTVGRRPNVRIIDEGEKMCVERSCMTRQEREEDERSGKDLLLCSVGCAYWPDLAENLAPKARRPAQVALSRASTARDAALSD